MMPTPQVTTADTWSDEVTRALGQLAAGPPLVHCLTNIVVAGFTANVLLAIGASPAMVENADEAAPFAALAGAVLVNLGTLSRERAEAMRRASASADRSGVPWVLDPVAVGAMEHRTTLAVELLAARPAIVRGNGSEIQALAAAAGVAGPGAAGRGVDSLASSDDALPAAQSLAAAHSCTVAVSGATDLVTDGDTTLAIAGGDPLLTRVTGTGCALGAVMAAFLAVGASPLSAAATASATVGLAGQRAAPGRGTGSFAVAFLDELGRMADLAAAPSP